MKQLPKKEQPDVAGGASTTEYTHVPCFPTVWPSAPEDGPTFPEPPEPCQSPTTI